RVSGHPFIAQVFHAGVSDDGRPYLVMEYYPGENFQQRARKEQMSVGEVLRTGVQLASAVETAHRASILHRDIKPANVLTSAYGDPGLTDFGIASGHGADEGASGVSIPWAAPEAITGAITDTRSDIYSLAATVYTLLAGRSPFEIPGGDNTQLALIERVERDRVPPTGRNDIPVSLENILANAMAKDPNHRPRTAEEFGRQLQSVESELKLPQTRLNLIGESRVVRSRADIADDDSTRVKGVAELEAQPSPLIRGIEIDDATHARRPAREREGILAPAEINETVLRPTSSTHGVAAEDPTEKRVNRVYVAAGAVAAALVLVVGLILFGGGADGVGDKAPNPEADQYEVNDGIDSPVAVSPPSVSKVAATDNGNGSYTYNWEAPMVGLTYVVTPDGSTTPERTKKTTYDSRAKCIQVETIGESGLISAATIGCVEG
ncbi:MAG: serine/threonine-protein kinase, partial [Actinomycetota bacterium]|nr:serine/threonine-protein kinase [Actinomycetota bacterium]